MTTEINRPNRNPPLRTPGPSECAPKDEYAPDTGCSDGRSDLMGVGVGDICRGIELGELDVDVGEVALDEGVGARVGRNDNISLSNSESVGVRVDCLVGVEEGATITGKSVGIVDGD